MGRGHSVCRLAARAGQARLPRLLHCAGGAAPLLPASVAGQRRCARAGEGRPRSFESASRDPLLALRPPRPGPAGAPRAAPAQLGPGARSAGAPSMLGGAAARAAGTASSADAFTSDRHAAVIVPRRIVPILRGLAMRMPKKPDDQFQLPTHGAAVLPSV